MKCKVEVGCCLCSERHETAIDLPEGWATRYDQIDEDGGFCPKHSVIAEFADDQCAGCVGGWQDCDLWRAFAYRTLNLTDDDFAELRGGICPKRTNGTFGMFDGTIEKIDLSERADNEAGAALAQAIIDYSARYHKLLGE